MMNEYRDRAEAGATLAGLIGPLPVGSVVLAVPRGGVPVAAPIARRSAATLGVLVAVKVGAPSNPEFAIGAVAPDGQPLLDDGLVARLGLSDEEVRVAVSRAVAEVRRRQDEYGDPPEIQGKVTVVVDDGVATGATLLAALGWVRRQGPEEVVCAVPVGPPGTIAVIAEIVDRVVCPLRPRDFRAVGAFYRRFDQVTDDEVDRLLTR